MGAVSLVLVAALGMHALSAIGVANVVHLLLEAQEYYTDLLFGTHNVRGYVGRRGRGAVPQLTCDYAGDERRSPDYARIHAHCRATQVPPARSLPPSLADRA
jgi:hypothetical protein